MIHTRCPRCGHLSPLRNVPSDLVIMDAVYRHFKLTPSAGLARATRFDEDLGAGSLDRTEVCMAIEELLDIDLLGEEEKLSSVGDLIDLVNSRFRAVSRSV